MKRTINDLLLEALRANPEGLSREDLIVKAWKLCKSKLGIKGYEELYPDNNKAGAILSHKKGIIKRGLATLEGSIYRIKEDERAGLPEVG